MKITTSIIKISILKYLKETENYLNFLERGETELDSIMEDNEMYSLRTNIYSWFVVALYNNFEYHLNLLAYSIFEEYPQLGRNTNCIKIFEQINAKINMLSDIEFDKKIKTLYNLNLYRNQVVHYSSRMYKPLPKKFEKLFFEKNILGNLLGKELEILFYYQETSTNDGEYYILKSTNNIPMPGKLIDLFKDAGFNLDKYNDASNKKELEKYNTLKNFIESFEKDDINEKFFNGNFLVMPKIDFCRYSFSVLNELFSVILEKLDQMSKT